VNPKTVRLALAIFIFVCALPAAVAVLPAAIAEEEDASLGQDLAGGIVSDVLDGSIDEGVNDDAGISQDPTNDETVNPSQEDNNGARFGGDTNTQIAVPIIDQDQGAANSESNLAGNLDLDIQEEVPPECPPGFTLNNNGQCEQIVSEDPDCSTGFTFNAATDRCERTVTESEDPTLVPTCDTTVDPPFTFNEETNQCEREVLESEDPTLVPTCDTTVDPPFTFNEETNQCERTVTESEDPNCSTGFTFNAATDQCEQRQTQALT